MKQEDLNKIPSDIPICGFIETGNVYIDGKKLEPSRSQQIFNHSPDGFQWGYLGSGPSQLALAILLEFTPEKEALKFYQIFKRLHVSVWTFNKDFEVTLNLKKIIEDIITFYE